MVPQPLVRGTVLAVGHDLVEVGRMARALTRHPHGWRRRVFTEGEWQDAYRRWRPAVTLAARFAAKEATFKAFGTGWGMGMRWQDVEVFRDRDGAPTLRLHGEALRRASDQNTTAIVSLSHTADLASAVVLLLGEPPVVARAPDTP